MWCGGSAIRLGIRYMHNVYVCEQIMSIRESTVSGTNFRNDFQLKLTQQIKYSDRNVGLSHDENYTHTAKYK